MIIKICIILDITLFLIAILNIKSNKKIKIDIGITKILYTKIISCSVPFFS